jgi:uncharacterized membrane protein YphA (DoxX/SURF4 family)
MRAMFVLGRMIFGGFFVWNGLSNIVERKQKSYYAGALLLAGGLSVMAGVKPREGLAAIIGFLIPVSLEMHRFWAVEDPQERQSELINFTKNMAFIGAALMMMELAEPWPASVDAARADDEDMYVRLGGRDLRALPA